MDDTHISFPGGGQNSPISGIALVHCPGVRPGTLVYVEAYELGLLAPNFSNLPDPFAGGRLFLLASSPVHFSSCFREEVRDYWEHCSISSIS